MKIENLSLFIIKVIFYVIKYLQVYEGIILFSRLLTDVRLLCVFLLF